MNWLRAEVATEEALRSFSWMGAFLQRLALAAVGLGCAAVLNAQAPQSPGPFDSRTPGIDEFDLGRRMLAMTSAVIQELTGGLLRGDTATITPLLFDATVPEDELARSRRVGCLSLRAAVEEVVRWTSSAGGRVGRTQLEIVALSFNEKDTTVAMTGALTFHTPGVLRYAPIELTFGVEEERLSLRRAAGLLIGLCNLARSEQH